MTDRAASRPDAFLADGGEMGARIRAFSWTTTPPGPPADWPASLKTLVAVMLNSGQPMFVAWGPERTMIYNDAFIPLCRDRHPDALGRPFQQVWRDVIAEAGGFMDRAFAGEPIHIDDFRVRLVSRHGFPEEAHFTFSLTPVRDGTGAVLGVLCISAETTEHVLAIQRLQLLFELSERFRRPAAPRVIASEAALVLGRHLRAGRIGYAEIDVTAGTYLVRGDWTDGTMPSIVGSGQVRDFGDGVVAALLAGRTVRSDDLQREAHPEEALSHMRSIGVRSAIIVPLFKDGRLVAAFFVHTAAPRHWTLADEALVRNVADRIWEAIGRARADKRVRDSEARLAFLDALAEQTRTARDPETVMAVTTNMLARHLDASHCAYADVDMERDRFTVRHDASSGPTSLAGEYRLSRFGSEVLTAALEGRPVVLSNVQTEIADPAGREAFAAIGVASMLGCPLVKDGRLVAIMGVLQSEPRSWQPWEIGLVRDVVERSWAYIERSRVEQSLREEHARKDEFLATLAHELRNPLAPIRTGLRVLELSPSDPEVQGRVHAMMARQLGHLVRLVDDLLDVSRVSRGLVDLQVSIVDLRDVVAAAIETSLPLIEAAQHGLHVEQPAAPIYVEADTTRLAQVLSNLLNNAAKYTPEGGRIGIAASVEGDQAVVRVEDSGIGIPPDMLAHVFTIFAQVRRDRGRAHGGLGLGLTLVRRLTEMHGGTVTAESTGKGSTFTVRLPLAPAPALPVGIAPVSVDTGASVPAARLRVLVVDDNVDAATVLALMIRMRGHLTAEAHDGVEALARGEMFDPDIVFLDIGLPGIDGYEVARRWRARPAGDRTLLVALTGWGSDEDKRRSTGAGFDHHLTKPAPPEDVEALLELVERRSSVSDPRAAPPPR